jgi:hypothetical protein
MKALATDCRLAEAEVCLQAGVRWQESMWCPQIDVSAGAAGWLIQHRLLDRSHHDVITPGG